MISSIGEVIKEHYATYVDARTKRRESHSLRLLLQVFLSVLSAAVLAELSEGLVSVVVTSLSILAGFSFSAMFPIAADIRSGLPEPTYSEDQDDLARLTELSSNFHANVSYFIPLTLVCIVLFLVQLFDLVCPDFSGYVSATTVEKIESFEGVIAETKTILSAFLCGFSIFFLLEVIYSFYRMCFTVLNILRIKEEYRVAHAARDRDAQRGT